MKSDLKKAQNLLQAISGSVLTREERIAKTMELASFLMTATAHEKTRKEKKQEAWLKRIVEDPKGRAFLTAMTDQVFRSQSEKRTASQLVYLIKKWGIPNFLGFFDKIKFLIFRTLGNTLPHLFIPIIRKQIRQETERVLLPNDPEKQAAYIAKAKAENVTLNINHLGEAILGENEAQARLNVYLNDLASPQIDYVSVKITTIYSQINMVSFEESLDTLSNRLRQLYNAAKPHKFVNLDMEEYKDLDLTVAVFKKVLDDPDQLHTHAGIVLQSYLPDTYLILQDLIEWAQHRIRKGGAPIRIRIVKGANWAMEAVESSLRGWELAPFDVKIDSDANFKRMLEYACHPDRTQAVHIGVGSHNLFDIAYTLILRAERKVEPQVSFEMLEGMAEPMRRVVKELTGSMLLYCPEAKEKDFHSSVAYLIRRLDENSGAENFLRHFFDLKPGNQAWNDQKNRFIQACQRIDTLPTKKNRTQNRFSPSHALLDKEPFKNEPDTDFSLPENRKWVSDIYEEWEAKKIADIPLVIGGKEIFGKLATGRDPSKPQEALYQYSLATIGHIDNALKTAKQAFQNWASLPFENRSHILGKAAHLFRERRANFIGAMIADGAKTVAEADPELSEAVDFIEYYRKIWYKQLSLKDLGWKPRGTILVAPPWNFPCSIPTGGIAAALTAGNCVIFKPAPEAVLVGWHVVQAFWDAGIPREILQWVNCDDDPEGSYLVKHPQINSVILTGGTQTAIKFAQMRPGLDLHAETGGKNAMIISAMCDRDLAIRDLVSSAFGHSGQKCSACSLAILDAELYDDPDFRRQLIDAVSSLKVGSAWDRSSKVIPLIRPPEGALLRGLTTLEPGESWLIEPKPDPKNPQLWSPGVKWGVQENSFTHQTEFFGPLLGVMRSTSLEEALRLANGTPYGLTAGLHSLDSREQEYWKEHMLAGNLYINRGMTGAIVRRQPFGGCKASSFGPGAKAGGPNYTNQLALPEQVGFPHEKGEIPYEIDTLVKKAFLNSEEKQILEKSALSYAYWSKLLKTPTDPSSVHGQSNDFYHVPLHHMYLRTDSQELTLPIFQVIIACLLCKTPLTISSSSPLPKIPGVEMSVEDESAFLRRNPSRIRLVEAATPSLLIGAAEIGAVIQNAPVIANGRIELHHYLREVALSFDYHRYGYIPPEVKT